MNEPNFPGEDAERIRLMALLIVAQPQNAVEIADDIYKLGFCAGQVVASHAAIRVTREAMEKVNGR